ncbi:ATP-binding cassette subfamily B protein/subfamily B ATP-binding cassette protein MsbA [Clostridium saccharoperbutylacetonicum]|uniref:ABC-type multidrug transport system, ATPase and permease component n=1 Tax=Clostridium saccharoperbutylacetonicum N1-4(HMT) TaxID=931276 RepID=M1MN99_9CLOT|nr:ABC transporter ATP-binding protein [Clostridium saccharoperbutylacetonicum]AGF57678.1 ABC-type multidrug transport system, ATPase and permease component [Clostridium saccharoperbutylacetonicum N1-4(HMT)]NRT61554.1 ATP-binding cassette subfamily B protein/subfamily B ATP-binding cassette protein MsbA [Clostridium saccharoperbutylacetonicum]NSB24877.1 ATP-binding cassette subfamily B protein/subfamily B ATP-binding cassette protein MsbA [Clostridium saccharoperbutylacetonicum]NSB44248.1 ATP-b
MKKSTFSRLIGYVSKYKGYMFASLIFALISNVLIAFMPLIVGKAIDYIVTKGEVDFDGLIRTIITLGVIYVISALFTWLFTIVANIVAYNTVKDLRNEALGKISILPLKYFDKNPHGDIISRLTNDMDNVSDGLFQGITQFYPGIITIISSLVLMLSLSFKLTIVIVLMTPLCFLIASFITKRSNKMFKEQQKTLGELNGYIEEIVGNQKVVRLFGYEERAEENFSGINARLYKCGQLAQFYSSLTNPATRFVNNVTYILVGLIGGILSVLSGLSVGVISSFLTYSTQFSQPINNITSVATQLQAAIASCERIFSIIDEVPEKADSDNAEKIESCEGNVKFENVSFSYDKKVSLIEDFSVDIKKGSTIAIVGPTGAGKTTMVNLLMRFYDLDKGRITVDGNSVNDLTRNNLRSQFGMVLQDTWLFEGTIRDNIAYGKPNASLEEVENAAKAAFIHSFIKRLPDGYDTMITESGGNLSEGQKQLLTIARVMLIDPPMLILDEATSNVDTRTELKIQNAFLSMMKGRTSFVIAHRLSTIRDADVILVMKNGKIVERGNHDELVNKGGIYTDLYNSQFKHQM